MSKSVSGRRLWAARVTGGLAVVFLLFDITIKLIVIDPVTESFARLGFDTSIARVIGALELVCLLVYLVPRTAVLGAVLLTGFLGGAIAIHVRVADPLLSHVLFPSYIAALLWARLYLLDGRLRALIVDFQPAGSSQG